MRVPRSTVGLYKDPRHFKTIRISYIRHPQPIFGKNWQRSPQKPVTGLKKHH